MKHHNDPSQLTPEYAELLSVVEQYEPDKIVLEILRHFLGMLAIMAPNVPQTVKMICDKTYWEAQEEWRQQNVGKHISRIVKMEFLPLKKVGRTSSNSVLYVRI